MDVPPFYGPSLFTGGKMFRRIIITIGLIALLPTVCIAGKINVKKLNKANWICFETQNFSVLTDAKEKKALEIIRELENFMNFLSIFFIAYEQKPLSEKVFVVAAMNKTSFKSLGMPENSAGFYSRKYGYTIFARCDGFRSSSKGGSNLGRTTVLRALVHLFLDNASSELALPPWYNAGIAEYFSTYMEEKGKVIIGDMSVLRNRFYSMIESDGGYRNVDTESLLKISRSDLNVWNKENRILLGRFYSRALLVVHYMLADTRRTEELTHYLYSLNKGLSIDESFKNAFKISYSELDKEVNNYIGGKYLRVRVYNPGKDGLNFPDVEIEKHDITKHDALGLLYTRLAILSSNLLGDEDFDKLTHDIERLHPGLVDDALQQQLTEHPENPLALLRFARTYDRMKKYAKAIDMYERAILLEEPDAATLNNYAWLLVTAPDVQLKNPIRAIELAQKAVDIERLPAYLDTLAEAYFVNGSTQKAIETINEAISLNPGNIEYYKDQLKKFKEAEEKL
jgi:tetratricopeptide (TPR) repeat protein